MKTKFFMISLVILMIFGINIINASAQTIPQSSMSVVSVSGSYDGTEFPPSNAIDGVRDNFWTSAKGLPQNIVIDLGDYYNLDKINLVPSQYKLENDSILEYKVYTSMDGKTFNESVSGTWENDESKADKTIELSDVPARYVKFEVIKANRDYMVISDISFEGTKMTEIPTTFSITVTNPTERQIVQRNDENRADITISGTYTADKEPENIEICAELAENPLGGEGVGWMPAESFSEGQYSGKINLKAGGWYTIKVRAKCDGEYYEDTVEKVGVGDIFLTAGQSNSACFGQEKTTPENDTVSTWNPNNDTWIFAADPQVSWVGSFIQYTHTNGQHTGGSPWPTLGDYLTEKYKVPVGFIIAGWGSSEVSFFLPGSTQGYYSRLKEPLEHFGVNGIKAVLWHQGESDAIAGTSAETYKTDLLKIIEQSRIDAGYDVPWFIATAAYHTDPKATAENQKKVVDGQIASCNEINIFRGPNTDDMLDGYRSTYDHVHLTKAGLVEHGTRWGDVLSKKLYHNTDTLYIANEKAVLDNGSCNISFKINNVSSDAVSFKAYVALYEDGVLKGIKNIDGTEVQSGNYIDVAVDFKDMADDKTYTSKVFIWSDDNKTPITYAINLF